MHRTLVPDRNGCGGIMPAVVQEVTGPVSFMDRLQDGRIIRRNQDHLRRCILDGEPEKSAETEDLPEILIDPFSLIPSPPETHPSRDGGSASGNSEESTTSTDSTEQPRTDVSISDTTTETATSGANAQNDPGNSRVPKSYPKRQRKQPDWYQNH